jgi:hypothetical protein
LRKSLNSDAIRGFCALEKNKITSFNRQTLFRFKPLVFVIAGLSHIAIMAVTGHKSEKAFLKYIRTTPQEYVQRVQEFFDKE